MYDFTFSGTEVLLGLAGLCLVLALGARYLRHATRRRRDLLRNITPTRRLSLFGAVGFSFLVINWTLWTAAPSYGTFAIEELDVLEVAPPRTPPPVEPPPPPPPPKIETVIDEVELEPVEFESMDVQEQDAVVATDRPLFEAPTAPPPPAPVAPPEPPVDNVTVIIAERMPVFGENCKSLSGEERKQCSDRALLSFIRRYVRYPAMARETGIQGTVPVRFIVEHDGTVTGVKALRDPGGGLGQEAERVLELINERGLRFRPGMQNGRTVRVAFTLPVNFRLE